MLVQQKWDSFIRGLANIIFFWFYGIIFFSLFRGIFILIFNKELGPSVDPSDYLSTFLMGFRFDCTIMGYFTIIPLLFLFALSWANKFRIIEYSRIICQYLFLIVSLLICIITINYYSEYKEQFNNFIFLGLYDDQAAVWKTIVDYYHPWLNLLFFVLLFTTGIFLFRRYEKGDKIYRFLNKSKTIWKKTGLVVLFLLLFVCGLRGSFTKIPAIRKWAAVSKDQFLNKTIINPYRSLKYAYEDFCGINMIYGKNPFGNEDLQLLFGADSVSQVIEKKARGRRIDPPKQIFLVIMESYDSWPLMDKYRSFGLSGQLGRIASEGAHFSNFLPAYNATIYAYNTIVTGIPYCGINMSYVGTIHEPYVTSIFSQFKKLGYTTRFFYGGFLSWENIGTFTTHLGCEQIYSGTDAGGKSDSGDWGIEDEKLFDLVLKQVDPEEYSFNLILTSSYHPPYAIDIYKKGFPYHSSGDFPEEARKYYGGGMNMKEMGHLWYSDREIGRFMEQAEKKYKSGLYAFTGDHYGRRFINHNPDAYEKSSVPFILYGNDIPAGKKEQPGDHSDIIPTLIELVAPEGFRYYSFGSSLFEEEKTCGMGFEKIIDRDSLFFFPKDAACQRSAIPEVPGKGFDGRDHFSSYQPDYRKRQMLAWHYIARGGYLGKP